MLIAPSLPYSVRDPLRYKHNCTELQHIEAYPLARVYRAPRLSSAPARKILSYYLNGGKDPHAFIFPILAGRDISTPEKVEKERGRANALVNKYLRKLADRAAINKPLTTHTARHSFADLARTEGWSIYDISKALQHHSIQVTERYLQRFDSKTLDQKMGELFGETLQHSGD